MKRNIGIVLLCLTILLSLAALSGCSHEREPDVEPVDPATYMAADSYKIEKAADGTYSCYVTDYTGGAIVSRFNMPYEPVATVMDEARVCMAGQNNEDFSSRWAAYCNVRTGNVVSYANYFTTAGNNVVHLEYLTDAYHVFIRDIYDINNIQNVVTLEGATPPAENASVVKTFEVNQDGDLVVTYYTKDGDKTVTVDLP